MKKCIMTFASVILSVTMTTSIVLASSIEEVVGNVSPIPFGDDKPAIIIGTLQWIGYAIAVGMIVYIGIKYILASADDKAGLKSSAFKWVAGALLIALAGTIANIVFNLVG